MAQQTYNNGDQLSVTRSVINNNATDAEGRLQVNEGLLSGVQQVTSGEGTKYQDDQGDYTSPPTRGTTNMRAEAGTSGPPSSGRIRWNNTTQIDSTVLYVSETNSDGDAIANYLANLTVGDGIYLQNAGDAGNYQSWNISDVLDTGSEKELTVTLAQSSGLNFSTNGQGQQLLMTIQFGAGVVNEIQKNQNSVKDQSVVIDTPAPTDYFSFYDVSSGEQKLSDLRTIVGSSRVDAYVAGTDTNVGTTGTFTAIPMFDSSFYSSSGVIIHSGDNTGFTVLAPLRYKVTASGWLRTDGNDDFEFQIFAGGVATGVPIEVSGDGNSKAVDFTIRSFTGVLAVNDKIEVRVKNNGDTINSIAMTFDIEFAGVD